MKFSSTATNENLPVVCMASESGEWEVGIRNVIFGYRVSLSEVNGGGYPLDICIGNNISLAIAMMMYLCEILALLPDEIPVVRNFAHNFPIQEVRPLTIGDPFYIAFHKLLESARNT